MNTETLSQDDIDLPRMIAWCMCSRHSPTCLSFWRLQIELKLAVLQNNRKYTSQNVSTKTFWAHLKISFFDVPKWVLLSANLSICQVASGMALETPLQGSCRLKADSISDRKSWSNFHFVQSFCWDVINLSFSWDGLKSLNIVETLAMVPFRVQKTVPNWWRDQLGIPHSGCALVTKLLDLRDSVGLQYQGASFRMRFPYFMVFKRKLLEICRTKSCLNDWPCEVVSWPSSSEDTENYDGCHKWRPAPPRKCQHHLSKQLQVWNRSSEPSGSRLHISIPTRQPLLSLWQFQTALPMRVVDVPSFCSHQVPKVPKGWQWHTSGVSFQHQIDSQVVYHPQKFIRIETHLVITTSRKPGPVGSQPEAFCSLQDGN